MFGALLMRVNDLHVLDSNSESRPQNDLSVHNVNAHILIDIGRSKLHFARRDKLHCNSESQESIGDCDTSVRINVARGDCNAVLRNNDGFFGNAGGIRTPADKVLVLTHGFFGTFRSLSVGN